ncbi:Uncharacterized protein dnm_044770 [Desulfonema magnum]|uniref:Uncharacterized protein n=1 Tax=Desulfonema magnum TaxID=45655 RepID=A0A975BMY6_9BACT|nr:Uncharacterized protein dnm_044770 [Desulfonema magnum]
MDDRVGQGTFGPFPLRTVFENFFSHGSGSKDHPDGAIRLLTSPRVRAVLTFLSCLPFQK